MRDEGGHDFKRSVVNAILNVIEQVSGGSVFYVSCLSAYFVLYSNSSFCPQLPESKDMGLGILCEFIEDCEYPNLSASILHILGQHGPSSATPSKYANFFTV